ncbi:hypothetical protein [Pseudonocardia asaccharolytica]|uniref:Uncharacterized protein n=1 Tax=Pseudonocardia asaccharolytica DSM 44247 = NBRC 16224 TaxID=1123024 RepID=A0A511D8Q8_9PSEU|nr:hypothetical protein [Pseudonocardia asaccharolytica]GEL20793.1 hypothetical protein PA7_46300 [Pseudonocardia asaccharolytica DSM 44247 = NBRC 16224]
MSTATETAASTTTASTWPRPFGGDDRAGEARAAAAAETGVALAAEQTPLRPGHPVGPHDLLPIDDVLDLGGECVPRVPSSPPGEHHRRRMASRRGARRLLEWLQDTGGEGWQQRWALAHADDVSTWVKTLATGHGVQAGAELRAGLTCLVLARVVQPGYQLFVNNNAVGLLNAATQQISPELFARIGDGIRPSTIPGVTASPVQISRARPTLAKIALHTGKDLESLLAEDLLEYAPGCCGTVVHRAGSAPPGTCSAAPGCCPPGPRCRLRLIAASDRSPSSSTGTASAAAPSAPR